MQQNPLENVTLGGLRDRFRNARILILGDVMLDAYFIGNINRISPEAPIPVVEVTKKEHRLGGAANVALNIKALGGEPLLCSVRGNDKDGERLQILLENEGIRTTGVLIDHVRPTTVKTRIIGNGKQVVRVDEESCADISIDLENKILKFLESELSEGSVLLIQDYNKGLLTEKLIKKSLDLARKRQVKVLVDPKKQNFTSFKGVHIFKPNRKEVEEGLNIKFDPRNSGEVLDMIRTTRKALDADHVLVTLSEHGVAVNEDDELVQFPAFKRNIVDVSGAGDTVISVAALSVSAGLDVSQVALLANLGGGLVCEQIGVVPLTWDSLQNAIALMTSKS
jgi:rfaE bifunctional protein kinase chain/domain